MKRRRSDYARRVPYYEKRYAEQKTEMLARARVYRQENRAVLKLARRTGVSIPQARLVLAELYADK